MRLSFHFLIIFFSFKIFANYSIPGKNCGISTLRCSLVCFFYFYLAINKLITDLKKIISLI